ncbi:MAG TPA: ABC transporter permease [Kribbella sp.]|nr:ABC transporter permease [Kribbella sp.]
MWPVFALLRKDLRVTARAPLFALLSVIVPVAFTMLYAIVIHVSTTAPVAVAVDDSSVEARKFVEVMRQLHNDDGRYYEIRTTDPGEARQMYADGTVGALVTIPAGFGDRVRDGERVDLALDVVNINADGVKNQHLRLEHAMRVFELEHGVHADAKLRIQEATVLAHDIPVTIYLGTALMVLAALYAGMVNAGTLIAREWEDRTAKSLLLSPAGTRTLVLGKWCSSAVLSLATVSAGVLGVGWVLGYPLADIGPRSVVVLAVTWGYGTALGTLLGVILRRSLPLIPIAVILSVGHFLVSGYESYIRGFAHGGVIEPLWRATAWIPLARLIEAFRFEVAGLSPPSGVGAALGWSLLALTALTALAMWRLTRTIRFNQGQ